MSGAAYWQCRPHVHHAKMTSDPAGYIWASKRWEAAELLQLHLNCSQARSQEWMSVLAQAATSLSKLDGLLLDCFEEDFKAWEGLLDMHLLNIILLHAQQLRLLQLGCFAPKFLMPLGGLEHLILSVGCSEADGLLSCIASAHSLKTLLVASHEGAKTSMFPSEVDLAQLSQLEAVSLRDVMPTRLALPPHCQLSVKVDSLKHANSAVWASVREHLVAFHITSFHEGLPGLEALPELLLQDPPLEKVRMRFESIGSCTNPVLLGAALARVPRLKLKSKQSMYVLVPSAVAWSSVTLYAELELQLEFESKAPHFQQGSCPAMSLRWGTLRGVGVMELFRDTPQRSVRYDFDEYAGTHVKISPEPGCGQGCGHWACSCACCTFCLERAGRMTAHWFDNPQLSSRDSKGWC